MIITNDYLESLSNVCISTDIQLFLIDGDGTCHPLPHAQLSSPYKKSFLEKLILLLLAKPSDTILLYQLDSLMFCGVTAISTDLYLVSMPCFNVVAPPSINIPAVLSFTNQESMYEVKNLIHLIPTASTARIEKCFQVCRTLLQLPAASFIEVEYLPESNTPAISRQSGRATNEQLLPQKMNAASFTHHSTALEDMFRTSIQTGNAELFLKQRKKQIAGSVGIMSTNSLQQCRYHFIIAIFNISRAAISGGVPYEYALELSDTFIQKMDNLHSVYEIDQLISEAGLSYCRLVNEYQEKITYNKSTKQVLEYIRRHLYEPISMSDLTQTVHLNRRSLSKNFIADTGMTITDYICQQRMNAAKELLENPQLSIIQISELLCYSSQSYFGKKFKATWGITPQKYRDSLNN